MCWPAINVHALFLKTNLYIQIKPFTLFRGINRLANSNTADSTRAKQNFGLKFKEVVQLKLPC